MGIAMASIDAMANSGTGSSSFLFVGSGRDGIGAMPGCDLTMLLIPSPETERRALAARG
jgi:hypothetical protein